MPKEKSNKSKGPAAQGGGGKPPGFDRYGHGPSGPANSNLQG
jgi:hypothetical protein